MNHQDDGLPDTPSRSASPGPIVPGQLAEGRPTVLTPEHEPYDYRQRAPERVPTKLDGFYLRIITLREVGGPKLGMPSHCLRCVPYSVDAGVQTLTLYEGRYYLEHQINGFRALGHYVVESRTVSLFNDPNCSQTLGRYRWDLQGRRLSFREIHDPCPYVDERPNDLTLRPWIRVDACTSGIDHWYPAFLGCR